MRKAFNFYQSHWEQIKLLNDTQKLELFNAICSVQFMEVNIDDIKFKDNISILVWTGIKHSINTSLSGFINKNKSLNKEVAIPLAKVGTDTPCQQLEVKGEEEVKEKEEEKGKKKRTVFSKPSIPQIQEEIKNKSFSIDAERFFHFYESKNWMVGKNKMKSWKSALVNWARTQDSFDKPRQYENAYLAKKQGRANAIDEAFDILEGNNKVEECHYEQ